jgi:transcription termination factor Rho
MRKGYVIQEEIPLEEKPLYAEPPKTTTTPRTVIILGSSDILRSKTRRTIIDTSKNYSYVDGSEEEIYCWAIRNTDGIKALRNFPPHYPLKKDGPCGMEVPGEVVIASGISEGDEVELHINAEEHYVLIHSVNGEKNSDVVRSWKNLAELKPDYPKEPLPIEKVKIPTKVDQYGVLMKDEKGNPVEDYDFDIRVATSITPIGMGQGFWLVAPGNSGKTYLLAKFSMALAKMTNTNPNLHFIIGYIGDRPVDFPLYENAVKLANSESRVEIHQSPWTDNPDCQVSMAKFIVNRARRLAVTRNVVLLIDSASRIVSMHTASSEMENYPGGMIRGGIYRRSIFEIIAQQFGTYGYFGENSSLTIIASVLMDEKSTEGVVAFETMQNTPNAILRLLDNPTLEYPRIGVTSSMSSTRIPFGKDFRSTAQRKEMELLEKKRWEPENTAEYGGERYNREEKTGKAELAQRRTLKYLREHLEPKY